MNEITPWYCQDILHLSVKQWKEALSNSSIFDNNALRMIHFVYNQNNCKSTATEIAKALSIPNHRVHYNLICAYNRKIAKALYQKYDVNPPLNEHGGQRFWNVVFDGDPDCPLDSNGHFYWKLRPNLVIAYGDLFT